MPRRQPLVNNNFVINVVINAFRLRGTVAAVVGPTPLTNASASHSLSCVHLRKLTEQVDTSFYSVRIKTAIGMQYPARFLTSPHFWWFPVSKRCDESVRNCMLILHCHSQLLRCLMYCGLVGYESLLHSGNAQLYDISLWTWHREMCQSAWHDNLSLLTYLAVTKCPICSVSTDYW